MVRLALLLLWSASVSSAQASEGYLFCLSDGQRLQISTWTKSLGTYRVTFPNGVRLSVPRSSKRPCDEPANPTRRLPKRLQLQELIIAGQPLVGAVGMATPSLARIRLADGNKVVARSPLLAGTPPVHTADGERARASAGQRARQASLALGVVAGGIGLGLLVGVSAVALGSSGRPYAL